MTKIVTGGFVAALSLVVLLSGSQFAHAAGYGGSSHTIDASVAGSNGTISPVGAVVVNDADDQTFVFTADADYQVDEVTVDGEKADYDNADHSYTFSDVTEDHTIVVSFERKPHHSSGGGGSNGSVTTTTSGGGQVLGAATYNYTLDLHTGSTGADVIALQTYLIAHGFAIPAGATGYFGVQTTAALAAFQAAHNIAPAVGYFGPITRALFMSGTLPE